MKWMSAWLLFGRFGLWVLAAAVSGAFVAICEGRSLTLVEEGKPRAVIVVAKEPCRSVQAAARELQSHIKKITKATVPIVSDGEKAEGVRILVGESGETRALGLKNDDFQPQEYLIGFRPDRLVLMGLDKVDDKTKIDPAKMTRLPDCYDAQGTCYAVYDFLERFCGVRWYAPTDLGMVFPESETLVVSGGDIRRKPAMEFRHNAPSINVPSVSKLTRGLWNNPSNEEMLLFARRLRLGGKKVLFTHSFYGYYDRFWKRNPKNPKVFESEHPEYFAQGYGDPPPQLCYTNPALIAQVVKDARDYFDGKGAKCGANVGPDYFALVPMDNDSYCKCGKCQAFFNEAEKDNQQFSSGKWSTYVFWFTNEVAKEIAKSHPDKFIGQLAYASYARYPSNIRLEKNIMVGPCLHTRNWWCPSMEKSDMAVYRPWVENEKGRPINSMWLYHCFPEMIASGQGFHCFPGFHMHTLAKQMRMFGEDGVKGIYLDGLGEQVDSYITFKMMDDPALDVDDLLDEFFERYYGKAGVPMGKLYRRIEEIYSNPKNYPAEIRNGDKTEHQTDEIAWGYLGTRERMRELRRYMEEAMDLAESAQEKRRVELFEKTIWNYMTEGQLKYLRKQTAKDEVEKLKNSEPPKSRIPKTADPAAAGDPLKVDWGKAQVIPIYRSVLGHPTDRKVEARLAHDGKHLYIRFENPMDTAKLSGGVWTGDHWEIFIAVQRGKPYRQLGITPDNVFKENAVGETEPWSSGLRLATTKTAGVWTAYLSLPLENLSVKGVNPGDKLYLNMILGAGGGNDPLAWSPHFKYNFHMPERLGEMTLE